MMMIMTILIMIRYHLWKSVELSESRCSLDCHPIGSPSLVHRYHRLDDDDDDDDGDGDGDDDGDDGDDGGGYGDGGGGNALLMVGSSKLASPASPPLSSPLPIQASNHHLASHLTTSPQEKTPLPRLHASIENTAIQLPLAFVAYPCP